jgi:hypothetical protein
MSESEDMVGEYYQAQNSAYYKAGVAAERKRIIDLLLDQNIIRRCGATDKLVAFNTDGTEVVYIKELED